MDRLKDDRHPPPPASVTDLHSNMDRLKAVYLTLLRDNNNHLHSNMDRLKEAKDFCFTAEWEHLHSNMDRLKDEEQKIFHSRLVIYIPIWID